MNRSLTSRLDRALAWIDEHLGDELTLNQLAQVAHVSLYHFARVFRALTGDSAMNYVRRRRLSHAVELLREQPRLTVLAVALQCGFGSHEGFTRAFAKQYGMSPVTYRRNADTLRLPIHRRFTMSDAVSSTPALVPTFETRPAFLAVGCAGEFKPLATMDISALWGTFAPRMGEISHRVGHSTYGICFPMGEGTRDPEQFTYIAAVQTSNLDDIPDGMTGVSMPACEYAVFTHNTGIGPQLGVTMRYIFGEWLAKSGHQLCGPDFEYYDHRFSPATGKGEFFVYVPIRRLA